MTQARLAALGGDLWRSWRMLALWPWPAVMLGRQGTKIRSEDYRLFTRLLMPGDFLLTRSEPYFVSNHFIGRNGTAFAHLAVYTGAVAGFCDRNGTLLKPRALPMLAKGDGPGQFKRTVTHAISEGVVCQDLLDVMMHADWVAAVRPWAGSDQAQEIRGAALSQVGLEYDFDFTPEGPEAYYCTGLGGFCCAKAGIEPPAKSRISVSLWGKKADVWLADSFLVRFPVVCASVSCADPELARKSRFSGVREALLSARDATS